MRGVVTASADRAAKVVRYALSEDEARASWLTWAKRQRFFPETLKHQGAIAEARAEWLPFYCFKVRASTVYKAEVCKEVVERNWNWAKLGYEETRRQEWAKVTTSAVETRYSATEDKRLQIFASFTYKPGLVIPTVQLSGEQLGQAVSLGELTQDDFKMVRAFDVFAMHPTLASDRVTSYIKGSEESKAVGLLHQLMPGTTNIKNITTNTALSVSFQPIYLPAWVVDYDRLSGQRLPFGEDEGSRGISFLGGKVRQQFRCFLNGQDGRIFGQEQYGAVKAGVPVALAGLLLSGGSFPVLSLLAGLCNGLGFAGYPFYKRWVRERERLGEQEKDRQFRDAGAQSKYERAYQEAKRQGQNGARSGGSGGRVKEHYRTLGVKPDASLKDLQQTFRKLSFQYHPDLHPLATESEKRAQGVQLAAVVKAYKVLRDPKRRSRYDSEASEA